MNDLPEPDLHAAFERRLAAVFPGHEERIHASAHRLQARQRNRVFATVASCGTGLAAALSAAALLLTAGASVAAGWTAIPTTPTPTALRAATAACNRLNDLARPNTPPVLSGTPVLTDARGSYTAAIYLSGKTARVCISNGQHTATGLSTDDRTLFIFPSIASNRVSSPTGGRGHAPGFAQDGSPTHSNSEENAEGLAGKSVTGIILTLTDGSKVTATVQGGWYFAWWPGDSWLSAVAVTTRSGTVTSRISCRAGTTGCRFAPPALTGS